MIPRDYITAWRAQAPWRLDAQVEQDLVISHAIVDPFSVPEVASSLVFRGGTALYKIYLTPPARYSEDIDLVQVRAEPIGETLDRARAALDPWLGEPRRVFHEGRVNLVYRFESEDAPPLKLKLKVEINTREHFTVLGVKRVPFKVDNPWFKGAADVSTYAIDELLCTKLRALYQRKKGRDLFDVWYAMDHGIHQSNDARCQLHQLYDRGRARRYAGAVRSKPGPEAKAARLPRRCWAAPAPWVHLGLRGQHGRGP